MSTRDKIVVHAERQLKKVGLERLSLRQIAAAVGIQPASVYQHFESKEAIVNELRTRTAVAVQKSMEKAIVGKETPEERLVACGMAYVAYALKERERFSLFFQVMRTRRRSLKEPRLELSPYTLMAELMADHVGKSDSPQSDEQIDELTYGYWSLIHGATMLRMTFLDGFRADMDSADRKNFLSYLRGCRSKRDPPKTDTDDQTVTP